MLLSNYKISLQRMENMVRQLRRLYWEAFEGTLKGASQALLGFTALWVYFAVINQEKWRVFHRASSWEYCSASLLLYALWVTAGIGVLRMCVDAVRLSKLPPENAIEDSTACKDSDNGILSADGLRLVEAVSLFFRGQAKSTRQDQSPFQILFSSQLLIVLYAFSSFVWLITATHVYRDIPWGEAAILCLVATWLFCCIIHAWQFSTIDGSEKGKWSLNLQFFLLMKDHSKGFRLIVFGSAMNLLTWGCVTAPWSNTGFAGIGFIMLAGCLSMCILIDGFSRLALLLVRGAAQEEADSIKQGVYSSDRTHKVYVLKYTVLIALVGISICWMVPLMQLFSFLADMLKGYCFYIAEAFLIIWCIRSSWFFAGIFSDRDSLPIVKCIRTVVGAVSAGYVCIEISRSFHILSEIYPLMR